MTERQQAHALALSDPSAYPHSKLRYLLYVPDDYTTQPTAPRPLTLFLHGAGERGDDLVAITRHGLPREIEAGRDLPSIVASPQCPAESRWHIPSLIALLDHLEAAYPIDRTRIYLTGLSMGGFGSWALAMEQPRRFAALAPICGGADPARVCALSHMPIWAFHGALDTTVPLARSTALINALYDCGGNPRFTVYPEAAHDSWTETYRNPHLYEWLYAQRRPSA